MAGFQSRSSLGTMSRMYDLKGEEVVLLAEVRCMLLARHR